MNNKVIIIGSNIAGIQAAMDLADVGIEVHLIESSPFLGNAGGTTVPHHLLNTRLLEVARHPNITLWTNTRLNRVEGEAHPFNVELRQHPRYVDLARCTACGECIAVCPVTMPGTDHKVIYLDGQPECAAIAKSGKSPCANACPGGIHVQGYVALIAQGRFQEAIDLIREAIPFPGICGRVCTHPCEINCRRAEIDKPVAVRLLKRFVSDWELEQEKQLVEGETPPRIQPLDSNAKRVAIIGAGPGGMALAERLTQLGHAITVFEKLPVIGGMMAVGIPEYRLPGEVINREYQYILDLGVEIRLNTTIGPNGDYTLDDLFRMGYEAICLAIGAHRSQNLNIPGENLTDVVHGIELLRNINLSQRIDEPYRVQYESEVKRLLRKGIETRVGILGGGNTAMDVSRSLRRLGVKDVRILYRRTRNEMPAMPEEIEDAQQEGVSIDFLVSPVRVLGDEENHVIGLECIRMKLGEPDASGRRRPVPIAESEFVANLDLVVLAVGQSPDLSCLGKDHDIAITRDERINVADVSFMTSQKGVFAVGDAVTSEKMVVIEAIGMGKKAAMAIDAYLRGVPPQEMVVNARAVPIALREITEDDKIPKPRIPVSTVSMEQRLNSFAEVELGYTPEQAIAEAQRCLVCGPCSECLACVKVCKSGAIVHEQQEKFIDLDIGAIIYADDISRFEQMPLVEGVGVYCVPPDAALLGSNIAARVMFDMGYKITEHKPLSVTPVSGIENETARIGVFICQCGGEISQFIDTKSLCSNLAALPCVVYTRELPFSCSSDASQIIGADIKTQGLNHVVLAGCSCCTIDQVCYSCTYQRLRCKQNLGMFVYPKSAKTVAGSMDGSFLGQIGRSVKFGLVNIREQCAWVHADDSEVATAKATALVTAAVARAKAMPIRLVGPQPVDKSALILGSGAAAHICQEMLGIHGITAQQIDHIPDQIRREKGQYVVVHKNNMWKASALVLSPSTLQETNRLLEAFGHEKYRPRSRTVWGGLETHRPGIFLCEPIMDPEISGAAVVARVAAWLCQTESRPPVASLVNPDRCRACGTCVEICEFGAPMLIEENGHRNSWIDPMICTGCGTCVARCPSGAITARFSSDAQLEAMLSAILAPSTKTLGEG